MASTNIINSTGVAVFVGGTASTNKVAASNDAQLSLTHDPRDITNKDSAGYRYLLEGLRSWSMSAGALSFNNPTAWGFTDAFAAWKNRTELTIYMKNADVSDDIYYYGAAYLTSANWSSPGQEDNVVYDVQFEGTGVLSEGNAG